MEKGAGSTWLDNGGLGALVVGGAEEKGVEKTEQRWRRRWLQGSGRGKVTAPTAIVQAVLKRARFKNSQNCETLRRHAAQRSLFSTQDVKPFLRPAALRGDLSFAS